MNRQLEQISLTEQRQNQSVNDNFTRTPSAMASSQGPAVGLLQSANLVTPQSTASGLYTGRTGGPGTATANSNLSYSASSANTEDNEVANRFANLSNIRDNSDINMPLKIESKEHLWKPAPIVGRDYMGSQQPQQPNNLTQGNI